MRRFGAALVTAMIFPALSIAGPDTSGNWPSFRGPRASGIADGQNPPIRWAAEKGDNVLWKTRIPGLGHSSPVVWDERVFVTSAVTDGKEPYLRPGAYGESPDNPENYTHDFRVYCLDKNSGSVLWEQTAHSGVPQVARHIKSSHANSTPATDGKHLVAFFGSEGLYCYDMDGKLLWKRNLGLLDAGAFNAPEIRWGFGSSPLIYKGKVIVLCDVNNQSFIAALDVESGKELWRTLREEVPGWCTPTVHKSESRTQIIVNGWKHIGGYDVDTGRELWRMSGGGDIPVPTPVVAHGHVFITNGHGASPIYAIRLSATGDISLADGEDSNEYVAWSRPSRGAYIPTPIVYGDYLYVGNDRGILTCYEAKTGRQMYRERIGGKRGTYSASAVAADGKLYFTSEEGWIHVVRAGPKYEHVVTNQMGGVCLATPAISEGTLLVRTSKHLYALKEGARAVAKAASAEAAEAEQNGEPSDKDSPTAEAGVELTDPVEIFKRVDAAAKAVTAAKYDVVLEGTGAAKAMFGRVKASVVASGYANGFAEKFVVEGEALRPGSEQIVRFKGGTDGDRCYLVDHESRMVHVDFELSVMGPWARGVRGALLLEFHHPTPFSDETNATKHEMRGSKRIGGVDCWEIHVAYAAGNAEATWFISKKDLLPRGRLDFFTLPGGEKGGLRKTLTNLIIEPKLAPDTFKLKVPEGYTKTDEPAS